MANEIKNQNDVITTDTSKKLCNKDEVIMADLNEYFRRRDDSYFYHRLELLEK